MLVHLKLSKLFLLILSFPLLSMIVICMSCGISSDIRCSVDCLGSERYTALPFN